MKYILDTSVLIHDPEAFKKFDGEVIIPKVVLEELDNLKTAEDTVGYKTRLAIKALADFIDSGSELSVANQFHRTSIKTNDSVIIDCADFHKGVLVTRDISCRLLAYAKNVPVEYYTNGDVKDTDKECIVEIPVSDVLMDIFYESGCIEIEGSDFYENQPVILRYGSSSGLAIYRDGLLKKVEYKNQYIRPIGVEQKFALSMLLDNSLPLVILEGKAGTGKTLISLAAALNSIAEDTKSKVLVAKPIVPVGGKSLGYLPGSLEEKLTPWLGCIYDNLAFLGYKDDYSKVFTEQLIEPMSIEHIRGRSLRDSFVIIEEAQNVSKDILKTIITRASENTKVVVCGDVSQIDSPYLDKHSSGLTKLIDRTFDSNLVGYVKLTKCVRSDLADYIDSIL